MKKYIKFINENNSYDTGYFNYNNLPFKLRIEYSNGRPKIYIIYKNLIYDDLSITIPQSNELSFDEFYLNPKLKKDLIDILEKEGFIENTKNSQIAGNIKTKSYKLI
jgi:hypothetical protein